jgi:alginate O-acetyltransferase complex protein AlgI
MVFNSNVFLLLFFPIVFGLFWLAMTKRQRYVLLTISGYVFYGYWDWRYCFLLLFSSFVSFFSAVMIQRSEGPTAKRLWLITSITVDLALLGFFKYYNFAAGTFNGLTGAAVLPLLNIILPIGISFYTFHTISYIVDVSQARVRPTSDIWEYFTYVCLFSQLVAGPIVRFRQIEDDLEHIDRKLSEDYIAKGIGFFTVGMIKKVVVADTIAQLINPMLSDYNALSMVGAWAAAIGYTFQLYYDFSGYSDMAIGLGYLFGIRIPQNFNVPYQALGIRDFWRRWHMSLSSWLRDYVYIPLGGNRRGAARTQLNVIVTMFLGGLWHGANWTFVVWGLYHGVFLILDRIVEPFTSRLPKLVFRWVTLLFIIVGWVIFRSTDFHMAFVWLTKMVGLGVPGQVSPTIRLVVAVAICFAASSFLPPSWDFEFKPNLQWATVSAAGLFAAYLFMNGLQTVFLYYQF